MIFALARRNMAYCRIAYVSCSLLVAVCAGGASANDEQLRGTYESTKALRRALSELPITDVKTAWNGKNYKSSFVVEVELGGCRRAFFRHDGMALPGMPKDAFAVPDTAFFRTAEQFGFAGGDVDVVPLTVSRRVDLAENPSLWPKRVLEGVARTATPNDKGTMVMGTMQAPVEGVALDQDLFLSLGWKQRKHVGRQLDWDSLHALAILDYICHEADRYGRHIYLENAKGPPLGLGDLLQTDGQLIGVKGIDNADGFDPVGPKTKIIGVLNAILVAGATDLNKTDASPKIKAKLEAVDVGRWEDMLARKKGIPRALVDAAVKRYGLVRQHGLSAIFYFPLGQMGMTGAIGAEHTKGNYRFLRRAQRVFPCPK